MRRFYFTNDQGDNVGYDHCGNIRGARSIAERLAKDHKEDIFINDCATDDIVEVAFRP